MQNCDDKTLVCGSNLMNVRAFIYVNLLVDTTSQKLMTC